MIILQRTVLFACWRTQQTQKWMKKDYLVKYHTKSNGPIVLRCPWKKSCTSVTGAPSLTYVKEGPLRRISILVWWQLEPQCVLRSLNSFGLSKIYFLNIFCEFKPLNVNVYAQNCHSGMGVASHTCDWSLVSLPCSCPKLWVNYHSSFLPLFFSRQNFVAVLRHVGSS